MNRGPRGYFPSVALGELDEIDDSGKQQTVSHQGLAGEIHTGVYRPQMFGLSSHPPKGSTGVVVSAGGERSRSVFIGGEHDDHRPTGLNEGECKLYDSAGNVIFLGAKNGVTFTISKGDVSISTKSGDVKVSASGNVYVSAKGKVYLGTSDGSGASPVMTQAGPSSKVYATV